MLMERMTNAASARRHDVVVVGAGVAGLAFTLRLPRTWRVAVSVGTAVFNDPSAVARVHAELAEALAARGFAALTDAVGYAHR